VSISPIIAVSGLHKRYRTSAEAALNDVSLTINPGEIFALLGPNGAGKTTLINIITGIVTPTSGKVTIAGYDIRDDYRITRTLVGLVPQELLVEAFETVWDTVSFSRRLFGKAPNNSYLNQLLQDLALWDKRHQAIRTLSGGMKRRLLIAKALAHEPKVLFLDEPSAGVDVELRRSMWVMIRRLRDAGVTIILTTHYLEEAEEMADRIAVINYGELILVDEKAHLLAQLGKKQVIFSLSRPLAALPQQLAAYKLELKADGSEMVYTSTTLAAHNGISGFLHALKEADISFTDFSTKNSSLEEIFITLLKQR
jgi:ABC-2 type transport system ATP-binding protein